MIKIRSKEAGFRRCGIAHPKEEVQYPDDRFTSAQLQALKAEPMLTVEVLEECKACLGERSDDADPGVQVGGFLSGTEADETGQESVKPVKPRKKGKR